jgi:phage baseplate assembly protein W
MATKPTRADTFTGSKKQVDFFSDFMTSFAKTPIGNQLAKVSNEHSVNQSLKNLLKTNLGERLFQPTVGSEIMATLFEMNVTDSLSMLEMFIRNTIENNEPRVNLVEVNVETVVNDENTIEITLIYNLINNPELNTLTMLLKRVR